MSNLADTWRVLSTAFGASPALARSLALFTARKAWNSATGALDHALFPSFRDVPITRPVFVVGNPRSGTTLMHRLLARSDELAAFYLWEMLFPAITSRKLLGPLVPRLAARAKQSPEAAAIHETGLLHAETDDAYLLADRLDGPLHWTGVRAWDPAFLSGFDTFTEGRLDAVYAALASAWQRNLYLSGKGRVVVKSTAITGSMPTALERYPDAKLLYLMRSPLSVIPSGLSLLEHNYVKPLSAGRPPAEAALRRYYHDVYQMMCRLYRDFHHQRSAGLLPDRSLRVVSYRRMMRDFEGEMKDTMSFLELDATRMAPVIQELAPRQRSHASHHRYTLEQYGLSEAQVRQDLSFIFENYDVEAR